MKTESRCLRMIKKKMVRVLTVAGLLACLASGCASGGSSVGKEAAADEIKKVDLRLQHPVTIRRSSGKAIHIICSAVIW